ncbi:MAG: hypothetical protein U9M95_02065 [Candidatus Altiarchaeota archaeon]|nr:hypothetical protein [Candidatus Altiarchaeota archaeon]
MKAVKMMGINRPVILAEWEDIEEYVKKDIKENQEFYEKLKEM